MIENMNFDFNINQYLPIAIEYGTKLLVLLIGAYVGMSLIKKGVSLAKKVLRKQKIDKTLTRFLLSIIEIVLKVLLVLSLVQYIGIPTTSFVAILASAGLAIGMALSGTLQNFAGGAMLLALRPFKVGDYVQLSGYEGTVEEIQIFSTILLTIDNKRIIIPNAQCSNASMTNYSAMSTRRIDLTIGIGYEDDIDQTKTVLQEIVENTPRIIDKDKTTIAVSGLGDNAVELAFRVWTKTENYWDVYFEINENIKKEFDKAGISFPFPQRDVHIYNEK